MASMLVVAAAVAVILQVTLQGWVVGAATTHVVGGSIGWSNSLANSTFYADWASSQSFIVGDILEFNFQTGSHDVVAVTKSGYDACSSNDQIASPVNNGPANIPLSSAGEHYYICSFSGHCSAGQKLAINVESAPSSSGDAPSPGSGAPPPPSSPAFVLVAQSYFMASGVILSMAHGLLNI